jgi:hypothetical protein
MPEPKDTYRPAFTLRKDGTFEDEADFDLERYMGKSVDEIPGCWPLVDDDRRVVGFYETWQPGEFVEHSIDGTVVDPEDGQTDYLTRP